MYSRERTANILINLYVPLFGFPCSILFDNGLQWLSINSATMFANGGHFWYKYDDGAWWLGCISASTNMDGVYVVRFCLRPGIDQASSFSGALHDFDGSCTRLLLEANLTSDARPATSWGTYISIPRGEWIQAVYHLPAPRHFALK